MKNYWPLALIFLAMFNPQADVHWPRWALIQMGLFGAILYHYRNRYHWSLLFTGFVTGMSSIVITQWRFNWLYMGKFKLNEIAFVQNVAAQGFMAMMILCLFLSQAKPETLKKIFRAFYFLSVFHSLLWISQKICGYSIWNHNGLPEWGLFGNTSMGACMNGIMISGIFLKQNKYVRVISAIALVIPVYWAQSSMGYLCLITTLIVYICFECGATRKEKIFMITGSLAMGLFVGQFFDYQFYRFTKIDRWDIWSLYLNWWSDNANHISGTGFGSFSSFGPGIQLATKFQRSHGGLYLWLHSDWLQILFELGYLGLISYLLTAFYTLKQAIKEKNHILLASASSFIVCMAGNYPTNLALFSFLGLTICFTLLKKRVAE